MDQYPYSDQWKAKVDRNGEAWRAYCEARSLVRDYFRIQLRDGKDAAKSEFDRRLSVLAGELAPCGPEGRDGESRTGRPRRTRTDAEIQRLREAFLWIGKIEGEQIKNELIGRQDPAPVQSMEVEA